MLAVNGKNIELTTFPDGTLLLKDLLPVPGRNIIVWKYHNETELVDNYELSEAALQVVKYFNIRIEEK